MEKSMVTDYIIRYMNENGISTEWVTKSLGIPEEKLLETYTEPLMAEEFLELCVLLHLSPEDIMQQIRTDEKNGKSLHKREE